jgi:NitT/TauT family transport system substrate-binding protein
MAIRVESVATAFAFVLGALMVLPSFALAQTLIPVRVTTAPIELGAQVYLASELGFFAKAGLSVDILNIQGPAATAKAVADNTVDIGYANIVPLAVAHAHGATSVLIAAGPLWAQNAKTAALFVSSASAIRTGKDFNGRVMGIAAMGTLTEFTARAWVDATGGDSSKLTFRVLSYASMPQALQDGDIDGAMVNEPFFQAARTTGKIIAYPSDAFAPTFLIGGWFASADWVAAHPDIARRFASAVSEAAAWANDPRNR